MSTFERYQHTLEEIQEAGLYKTERVITTPQSVEIKVQDGSVAALADLLRRRRVRRPRR